MHKHDVILPERLDPRTEAFRKSIDEFAIDQPEIAAERTLIEKGGAELLNELGISPELFDDKSHAFFFAALAQRNGHLEQSREGMSVDAYTKEKTFIFNATALLALGNSDVYDKLGGQLESNGDINEDLAERVINKFTNHQVTVEMKQAIESQGLFDDVKASLHITDENEDPYELCVLNVANNDSLSGMQPSSPKADGGFIEDDEARKKYLQDSALFESYQDELIAKGGEFQRSLGFEYPLPLAWTSFANDKRYLCLALPTAEKILYPNEQRADSFTEDRRQVELATLKHEYAHTQGGHNLDGRAYYGISFEEYRAEISSGNKQGYEDLKSFMRHDLFMLTGLSLDRILASVPKGGRADRLYPAIASVIGMQRTLELALTVPTSYVAVALPVAAEVYEYLGGYDGFSRRYYESASPEKRMQIDGRIAAEAEYRKDKPGTAQWLRSRKGMYGLGYMTDKLATAIDLATGSSTNHQNV